MANENNDVGEIFPGSGGVLTLPDGINGNDITSKVEGAHIILSTGEYNVKILYGTIFTALGHEFTLQDQYGNSIKLNEISHDGREYKIFDSVTAEYDEEELQKILDADVDEVDSFKDAESHEKLQTLVAELEQKVEQLEAQAQEQLEAEEREAEQEAQELDNLADNIESLNEEVNVISQVAELTQQDQELLTLEDIVNELVKTPEAIEPEDTNVVIDPISQGANNENVETLTDTGQPTLDWRLTEDTDSGRSTSDFLTNIVNPTITGLTDPNLRVSLYNEDGDLIAQTRASQDGDFRFSLSDTGLDEGANTLTIVAENVEGNTNEVSKTVHLDTSASLTLSIHNDEGIIQAASTNDNSPGFAGTAEAHSDIVVRVYDAGGNIIWLSEAIRTDNDGQWVVPESSLRSYDDGEYRVEATVIDLAGNTHSQETAFEIDTHTITPTIAINNEQLGLDDAHTNHQNLELHGSAEENSIIHMIITDTLDNDQVVTEVQIQVDDEGNWSYNTTDLNLSDGNYRATIFSTDEPGNDSEQVSIDWTLDTQAPELEWSLRSEMDTGVSDVDLITRLENFIIEGTTEPNTLVSLFSQEGALLIQTMSDEQGAFEFEIDESLVTEGNNFFTIQAIDLASNETSVSHTIVVDTDAEITLLIERNPDAVIEGVYKDASPGISGSSEVGSNITVNIYSIDGDLVWSLSEIAVDEFGVWTIAEADLPQLLDGAYRVEATASDIAGNENTVSETIIIDTQPPIVDWMLSVDSDSGALGDYITNVNTPRISGQIDQGDRIFIEDADGNPIEDVSITNNDDGEWFAAFPELSDGDHEIVVKVIDSAGNVGSQTKTITIDTIPPEATDISIFDNFYDEFSTSASSIVLAGSAETDSQVILLISGDELDSSIEIIVDVDEQGAWNYPLDFEQHNLPQGNYEIQATVRDQAGNLSEVDSMALTIDRDAFPPTIAIAPDSDTGVDTSDFNTSDTTPRFVGMAEPLSVLNLLINGTEVAQILVDEDGNWEYQIPDELALSEGEHLIEAYITDVASNVSEVRGISVIIDTTPPDAPSPYSSEIIFSNDTEFTFSGEGVPADTRLFLILHAEGQESQRFEIMVNEDGSWSQSLFPQIELVDGVYQIGLEYEDRAGNTSQESALTTLEISTALIDSPHTLVLVDGDSGEDTSDRITNEQQLTVQVTAPEEAVSVKVIYSYVNNDGGVIEREIDATQNNDGTWNAILEIDNTGNNLDDGVEITVDAVAEDRYGNTAESDEALTIIYDEHVGAVDIQIIASDSQNITNQIQPEFRLLADEQVSIEVSLFRGNDLLHRIDGLTLNAGDELDVDFWTDNPALADLLDGEYQVEVTATDQAGNQQQFVHTFVVDTVAPTETSIALDEDSQGLFADLTNTFTPSLVGNAEANTVIQIYNGDPNNGGVLLGEVTADENGDWQLDISLPEIPGAVSLYTVTTDEAGNSTSGSSSFDIDISTEIPNQAQIIVDELAHPILPGSIDNEHGSTVTNPKFKIANLPADETIYLTISLGDEILFQEMIEVNEFGEALFNQDGSDYELIFNTQGNNQITVEYIDSHGNPSPTSDPANIYIDSIPPQEPTIELISDAVSDVDGVSVFNSRSLDFEGQGEPGSELRVQIRRVGTAEWITYTSLIVGDDGQWNLADSEIEILLSADGEYEFRAVSIDEVDNVTANNGDPERFIVDTVSEFDFVSDDMIRNTDTELVAEVEDGSEVNILSITLDGTELSIDSSSTPDGTVIDSDWTLDLASFLPNSALDGDGRPVDGVYTISFEVTDPYQNVVREDVTIEIKSSIADPELVSMQQDEGSNPGSTVYENQVLITFDSTPILVGTAEANARIFITGPSGIVQTFADEEGNWQLELSSLENQADQDISLSIIAQDEFGNASVANVTVHYDDGVA